MTMITMMSNEHKTTAETDKAELRELCIGNVLPKGTPMNMGNCNQCYALGQRSWFVAVVTTRSI